MSRTHDPTIDLLLRLVPDSPQSILQHLTNHPSLASASDSSGYSLLHAAASYNQLDLLRTLVRTYGVNPNEIEDSEGETPLFAAETVAAARCLVEELGADAGVLNEEGVSAEDNARDNVEDGGEWLAVADYLASRLKQNGGATGAIDGGNPGTYDQGLREQGSPSSTHPPPPLPPGVRITGMRTVPEDETGAQEADPEFRRRIEELAARDDFQGEEGQKELKKLVEDAVGGLRGSGGESTEGGREVRRRID